MPRFYFHVHDGEDILDDEGVECADLHAARAEAIRASGEMLRDKSSEFWTGHPWEMNVVDDGGEAVCKLTFKAE